MQLPIITSPKLTRSTNDSRSCSDDNNQGETFDSFYKDLLRLVETCAYHQEERRKVIRDQIVMNITSDTAREKYWQKQPWPQGKPSTCADQWKQWRNTWYQCQGHLCKAKWFRFCHASCGETKPHGNTVPRTTSHEPVQHLTRNTVNCRNHNHSAETCKKAERDGQVGDIG